MTLETVPAHAAQAAGSGWENTAGVSTRQWDGSIMGPDPLYVPPQPPPPPADVVDRDANGPAVPVDSTEIDDDADADDDDQPPSPLRALWWRICDRAADLTYGPAHPADTDPTPPTDKVENPPLTTVRLRLAVAGKPTGTLVLDHPNGSALLGHVAATMADLRSEIGESCAIIVDRKPLTPRQKARHIANLGKLIDAADNKRRGIPGGSRLSGLLGHQQNTTGIGDAIAAELGFAPGRTAPRATQRPSLQRITEGDELARMREETKRHAADQPLYWVHVTILVRCVNKYKGRTAANALRTAMTSMNGRARWRAQGFSLSFAGQWLAFFDLRKGGSHVAATNRARMPRASRHPVSAAELMPLIIPATNEAASDNIRRSAALKPSHPDTPRYDGKTWNLYPLGWATDRTGQEYLAALNMDHAPMTLLLGGTGSGKSTTRYAATIHSAMRTPASHTWIDPEGEVFKDCAPYLGLATRPICNIDLRGGRQPAWNLLDMSQRDDEDIDDIKDAVVGAIKNGLGWTDSSNRALTLMTMGMRTLLRLNSVLCRDGHPELQATLFTFVPLLTKDAFLRLVNRHMPPDIQAYWADSFPALDKAAVPVVTNLIQRLRGDFSPLGAMLGRPISTYSSRLALAEGWSTFICPQTGGADDALVANFFLYDLNREARRRDAGTGRPGVFDLDEFTSYDANDGLAADILNRLRKRRIAVSGLAQNIGNFTAGTQRALASNVTAVLGGPARGKVAKVLGEHTMAEPEAFTDLENHQWVGRIRVGTVDHGPTLYRGLVPDDVFAELYDPEATDRIIEKMDTFFDRKTRAEAAEEIDTHQARLTKYLDHLAAAAPRVEHEEELFRV